MTAVSVISIFCNRESLVEESVASLISQTGVDEILLVDDGSTDRTGERLSAFANGRVRILRQENRGFTPTLVSAIAAMSGDYIAIHGSGDTSLPGRFAAQAAQLDSDPGMAVTGCWRRVIRTSTGRPDRIVGPDLPADLGTGLEKRNPYAHGDVMIRRSHYLQAGGYRTAFRFAQDRDLWFRLSRVGRLGMVPQVLYAQHELMAGSVGGTPHKRLIQRFYSDLAAWCHRECLAGRPDPVDRFGTDAFLLRPRSRSLARELAVSACGYLLRKDAPAGRAFLAASLSEGITIPGLLGCALTLLRGR